MMFFFWTFFDLTFGHFEANYSNIIFMKKNRYLSNYNSTVHKLKYSLQWIFYVMKYRKRCQKDIQIIADFDTKYLFIFFLVILAQKQFK